MTELQVFNNAGDVDFYLHDCFSQHAPVTNRLKRTKMIYFLSDCIYVIFHPSFSR